MKLKVPFYSNTPDDTHCFQAVIRMVLKYFLPDKEFSWKELEKMTAKKPELWTWGMQGLINLKKMGFEVISLTDFDYEKFSQKGGQYLVRRWGKEVGGISIQHSDIPQEMRIAKDFIKIFGKKTIVPDIADIKRLLKQGYLVICNVNSRTLNNKEGYVGHFVLVFGFDKNNLYLHDPGLPPRKNRKVPIKKFIKAWAYPLARDKNLIALKLNETQLMEIINLKLEHTEGLLDLEEKMYWQGEKWKSLWEKEAKEKSRAFITDYLTNFPKGCFGLVDKNGGILGATFLLKVSQLEPIPYLHKVSDYLKKDGEIAYVSLFVVKKGRKEWDIAQKLYDYAEEVAFFKLKCKTISAVIYSSPMEEKVVESHNYEKLNRQFEWEIYPGKIVPCWIYYYELLMKRAD